MTFSRRQFCGTLGAGLALANMDLFADEPKPKPLRVIAYNIFKLTGWPSDRPLAKQAVAKGQMAKRFQSIAFPLIGAGSGGYNQQRAKEIMLDELAKADLNIDTLIVEFKKKAVSSDVI
jgi:hypothetical protein